MLDVLPMAIERGRDRLSPDYSDSPIVRISPRHHRNDDDNGSGRNSHPDRASLQDQSERNIKTGLRIPANGSQH